MTSTDRHIGMRLKSRRLELGITEAELSLSLGLAIDELVEIEAGRRRLVPDLMARACTALDATVAYFFAGQTSPALEPAEYPPAVPPSAPSA